MDLGLQLKQAAKQLGAQATSVANWESGTTKPDLHHLSLVLQFLEYDPRPVPETIAGRLMHYRVGRGISQLEMAHRLGIDPSTLARWERGEREPRGKYLATVEDMLSQPSNQ